MEDEREMEEELESAAGEAEPLLPGEGELPAVSRKVRRRGRRTRARSRTIAPKRLTKEELRMGELLSSEPPVDRPQTRADCKDMPRPCPFVSCKHHLYLDVNPETGSIKLNFPDIEVSEMVDTCALDVADRGGITLEEVGAILNLTRERIRQVEVRGLLRLKTLAPGWNDDGELDAILVEPAEASEADVSPTDEPFEEPLFADVAPIAELPVSELADDLAADAGEFAEELGGQNAFQADAALLAMLQAAGK